MTSSATRRSPFRSRSSSCSSTSVSGSTNLSYGLSALISLFHDVIIVLGLYALLWGILPISLEIDEAFIGVILTVIGYSINDTVVVFDRIREYLRDHKREDTVTVFNKALNSTLRRTVNTGFCTLLVLWSSTSSAGWPSRASCSASSSVCWWVPTHPSSSVRVSPWTWWPALSARR
ncbi:MAG: hypothetical protein H6590_02490 [Flavobacteriales bacterium]|nr:hypothetical protein [Flavobacteriales bacterium]